MTYKELLEFLNGLSDKQLNQQVLVYDGVQDEYHPASDATFTVGDDRNFLIKDNHPTLLIK